MTLVEICAMVTDGTDDDAALDVLVEELERLSQEQLGLLLEATAPDRTLH